MAVSYAENLPISRGFLQNNKGRRILTVVTVTVDDMILSNGYEEMDMIIDEKLGTRLDDLYYTKAQRTMQGKVVLEVSGVVTEDSLELVTSH